MANSFMLAGKKMVLDRGRFKELANVGSQSAKKGFGVMGVFETKAQARKRFEDNEAKNKRYENAKANQAFAERTKREYQQSFGGKLKEGVKAIKTRANAEASLAKEKMRVKAQKAGFGKETYNADEKFRGLQKLLKSK